MSSFSLFEQPKFITSAANYAQLPPIETPEVCFCGRSNVGKSSLINAITNHSKLAMVSQRPGKTRLLNLFSSDNDTFHWVDLPGFGFAHVPETMRKLWKKEIDTYLLKRPNLVIALHLVDIRHEATPLDREFMLWMAKNDRPFINVLTKADKLSKNKQVIAEKQLQKVHEEMNIEVPIVVTSSEKGDGIVELKKLIREFVTGKFEIVKE
jgi:GTP-binding protein